jgi:hypothetical protein
VKRTRSQPYSEFHALRHMRRIGGFKDMLEDHVEKSHEDGDKHDQRVARVARCKLLALREDSKQSWGLCCSERSNGKEKAPAEIHWNKFGGKKTAVTRSWLLETPNARVVSLPSRCDYPVRKCNHGVGTAAREKMAHRMYQVQNCLLIESIELEDLARFEIL